MIPSLSHPDTLSFPPSACSPLTPIRWEGVGGWGRRCVFHLGKQSRTVSRKQELAFQARAHTHSHDVCVCAHMFPSTCVSTHSHSSPKHAFPARAGTLPIIPRVTPHVTWSHPAGAPLFKHYLRLCFCFYLSPGTASKQREGSWPGAEPTLCFLYSQLPFKTDSRPSVFVGLTLVILVVL